MNYLRILPVLTFSLAMPMVAQSPDAGPGAARRPAPVAPQNAPGQDAAELQAFAARGQLPPRPQPLLTPIHTAAPDLGIAYGIWAAGDDYKASFHDGMTFVPYLGAGYPHNQPWSWRTTSVRSGNLELLEGNAPATASTALHYEYRYGAVTEAYDVRHDGLEQTFVLAARGAVTGDLVIRGTVKSQLVADDNADGKVTYADDQGHAILTYGAAAAIDAAGRKVDLVTSHQQDSITLTVPSAWLDAATFPVVVDPLLARVLIATWGAATFGAPDSVDVGRDDNAVTSNVMVTYTRFASATDGDMWGRLNNDDFSNDSLVFTDITASWDTNNGRCAFVGGSNMWALVFSRFFPGVTPLSQVRCHVHASGDTTLLTSFGFFVPPANHNDWRPDVGGVEAFVAGSDALVVFQREDNTATAGSFANTDTSEVWGSLLDTTTANGTFGAPFLIRSFTSSDSERPTVNQAAEGGAAFSWICVCQEYNNSITNDDWDLIGRRISNTGAVATGTFITDLATLGNTHQLGPVVAGESGRYAVTFTTVDTTLVPFKTGLIAGKEVRTERFNWANALAGPSLVKPNVVLRANADRRWEATGLAYDSNSDSHWGVGFRAIVPGVPVAYYARIGFNGEATEGPIGSILYSVAGDTTTEVAVTFNNDLNTFQYAYGVNDGTITLPIYGQVLEYAVPSPISTFGISCSAANLSWTPSTFLGSQQIGCEFTNVNVTGAPVGAAHFMAASFGTTNVAVLDPAVAAGCRLFIQATGPLFLGVLPLRIGANANWSLPLPEFLPSTTLHFQDWYLDGAQFHSTERLTVPIIK